VGGRLLRIFLDYGIVVFFIILCAYLAYATEDHVFISPENLFNVLRQISINTVLAVGMTFVILTAGIDLSIGSVLAFSAVVGTDVMLKAHGSAMAGVGVGLGIGLLAGLINGFIITRFRIPPFIQTLAMMTVARGLALKYTEALPLSDLPDSFTWIGRGYIGPVPFPAFVTFVVVLIAYILLSQTRFGRYVYAIGGNEQAALLSGIRVNIVKVAVYGISGLMCGLSGILLAARLGSGDPKSGQMYELNAIAAVVLGGTSLMGGRGGVPGTLLGALLIGVLDNGLILLQYSAFDQMIAKGMVILAAVLLDQIKKRT